MTSNPYDELHRAWVKVFTGYDLVQEQGRWRRATQPERDSIALLAAAREKRNHAGDTCAENERQLDDATGELNDARMSLVRALGGPEEVHAPDLTAADMVRLLREDRDRFRELLAAREGVWVAHARWQDADDLSKACGVETGVLHWHELIERVAALRALVEPDAEETP